MDTYSTGGIRQADLVALEAALVRPARLVDLADALGWDTDRLHAALVLGEQQGALVRDGQLVRREGANE